MQTASVILAAGKGTRMNSSLPKVLHPIHGRSMVEWVIHRLREAGISQHCLIIGGDLEAFSDLLAQHPELTICEQMERQGTGDAVASARPGFLTEAPHASFNHSRKHRGDTIRADYIFICTGDTPNIDASIIRNFMNYVLENKLDLGLLAMRVPDPKGYGRVIKTDKGEFKKIVEEKDAHESEKNINLCNSGLAFGRTDVIFRNVAKLLPNNAQKEYYFTDVFHLAQEDGAKVGVYETEAWQTFIGVNTQEQLRFLESLMQGEN